MVGDENDMSDWEDAQGGLVPGPRDPTSGAKVGDARWSWEKANKFEFPAKLQGGMVLEAETFAVGGDSSLPRKPIGLGILDGEETESDTDRPDVVLVTSTSSKSRKIVASARVTSTSNTKMTSTITTTKASATGLHALLMDDPPTVPSPSPSKPHALPVHRHYETYHRQHHLKMLKDQLEIDLAPLIGRTRGVRAQAVMHGGMRGVQAIIGYGTAQSGDIRFRPASASGTNGVASGKKRMERSDDEGDRGERVVKRMRTAEGTVGVDVKSMPPFMRKFASLKKGEHTCSGVY